LSVLSKNAAISGFLPLWAAALTAIVPPVALFERGEGVGLEGLRQRACFLSSFVDRPLLRTRNGEIGVPKYRICCSVNGGRRINLCQLKLLIERTKGLFPSPPNRFIGGTS